jgi:hypothetical protein
VPLVELRAMKNPWVALPLDSPFVISADEPHVDAFNANLPTAYQLDLSLMPHPFFGDREARLVILGLNPGIGPTSHADHIDGGGTAPRQSGFRPPR